MKSHDLKKLICRVLQDFNKYSEESVDLLLLTCAQESSCGQKLFQIGGGPALGIFQMEIDTLHDIINNYLIRRKSLYNSVRLFMCGVSLDLNLTGNILFQIVIARVYYMRIRTPIPKSRNYATKSGYIYHLAKYWKKYWNTSEGKGTIEEAIRNYNRYIKD